MKHLKRFNEGDQYNDCHLCKSLETEEWLDELDRESKFNESDDFPTKPGFVERRLALQKEYESKYRVSFPIPTNAYSLLKNSGVADDKIVEAYQQYVNHALGLTYGTDLEEFRNWCNESDNLVDFQNQKPQFSVLSKEEKEKMMSDALKMSEDQWMKKYKVGDHGDYLRMARSKWNVD
jgi:hypothetical protein